MNLIKCVILDKFDGDEIMQPSPQLNTFRQSLTAIFTAASETIPSLSITFTGAPQFQLPAPAGYTVLDCGHITSGKIKRPFRVLQNDCTSDFSITILERDDPSVPSSYEVIAPQQHVGDVAEWRINVQAAERQLRSAEYLRSSYAQAPEFLLNNRHAAVGRVAGFLLHAVMDDIFRSALTQVETHFESLPSATPKPGKDLRPTGP